MGDDGLRGIQGVLAQRGVCLGLSFGSAVLICAQCAALGFAITSLWQGVPLSEVIWAVLGFISCFAGRLGLSALEDFLSCRFAFRVSGKLEREYLNALAFSGPALVQRFGPASSVLAATADITKVRDYIASILPKQVSMVVIPLSLCVAIFAFDEVSGFIVAVCFPFIIIFMRLVGHTASDDAARRHEGFAQMSDHFMDALRGLSTLRVFGRAQGYGKAVFAASEEYRRQVMRTLRTATLSSTVLDIFATCGLAAVAIMLGFRLVEGEVSFFPALCVLLLVPEFFIPIRRFAKGFHASLEGKSALTQVRQAIGFATDAASRQVGYESMENEPDLICALNRSGLPHIRFEGVRFSYGSAPHILKDATFDLGRPRLVVVTGPSGAGKSTLLDILAGFTDPTSGRICVNGAEAETLKRADWHSHVAYIPQRPHIFNASLRDNVRLLDPKATDERIADALRQVGLGRLVEEGEGLDALLGEGGRPLSGGEAHRVALARALADPGRRVVVLDEPTAHLDIITEYDLERTLQEAFASKLVIMATHRLRWTERADVNLVVEGGRVRMEGPRAQTRGVEDDLDWFRSHMSKRGNEGVVDGPVAPTSPQRKEPFDGDASAAVPQSGPFLVRMLFRNHAGLALLSILLSVVAALFASALMFTSGYMISLAAAIPFTVLALHLPSILVRIFGVGKPLIDYIERLLGHDWVLRATSLLRRRLFEAVERQEGVQRTFKLGDALATLTEDIAAVQDLFLRCVFPLACALILVLIVPLAASFASALLGAALFVLMFLATVGIGVGALLADRGKLEEAQATTRSLYSVLTDHVLGIRDVILSGQGSAFAERIARVHERSDGLERSLAARKRLRSFACQLLMGFAVVLCLIWSSQVFTLATDGVSFAGGGQEGVLVGLLANLAPTGEAPWPPNWITAFSICLFPLIEFLLPATEAFLEGYATRQGAQRLGLILGGAHSTVRAVRAHVAPVRDVSWAVEMEGVGLSFPGCSRPVLRGLDLRIPKGSLTAVVGPSGAGKSTFARLISRILRPTVGTVRIQGSVGLIEQDAYVFHKSLRENLLIADGAATDDQLVRVLGQVGLSGLLERLPKGLDSMLAAGGEDVSGGEACRITVARALLAGFDTIILDEPFRALDPDTERAVMDTIQETLADKTVIVITHHIQDIRRFDDVIFMTAP